MNIVIVLEMPVLEAICVRKRFLRKPTTISRQVQECSSSNTRSKTPGRRQIEWRDGQGQVSGYQGQTSQCHDHRCCPGCLCSLVGRTGLLLVCLLRGPASHKKRLPMQFASSSIIITIFMRPQMTSQRA